MRHGWDKALLYLGILTGSLGARAQITETATEGVVNGAEPPSSTSEQTLDPIAERRRARRGLLPFNREWVVSRFEVEERVRILLTKTPVTAEFLAFLTNAEPEWVTRFSVNGDLSLLSGPGAGKFVKALGRETRSFDVTQAQNQDQPLIKDFFLWKIKKHPKQLKLKEKQAAQAARERREQRAAERRAANRLARQAAQDEEEVRRQETELEAEAQETDDTLVIDLNESISSPDFLSVSIVRADALLMNTLVTSQKITIDGLISALGESIHFADMKRAYFMGLDRPQCHAWLSKSRTRFGFARWSPQAHERLREIAAGLNAGGI